MITLQFYINKENQFEEIYLVQLHDNFMIPFDKGYMARIEEDLDNDVDMEKCEPDNYYKAKMKLNYERDGAGAMQISHWSIVEMFNCTRVV